MTLLSPKTHNAELIFVARPRISLRGVHRAFARFAYLVFTPQRSLVPVLIAPTHGRRDDLVELT